METKTYRINNRMQFIICKPIIQIIHSNPHTILNYMSNCLSFKLHDTEHKDKVTPFTKNRTSFQNYPFNFSDRMNENFRDCVIEFQNLAVASVSNTRYAK